MNSAENTGKVDKYNESGRNSNIISDIHNYWGIVKRHWLPAVAIFGTVVALSNLYASTQPQSYRAQGQLLFKQEDKGSSLIGLESAAQQGSSQASGWLDADRILDTEIRVLLSGPILQQTLNVLKKKNPQGIPLNVEEFQKALAIKKAPNTNVLTVSYQSTDAKGAALVVNQIMNKYLENNLSSTRATATAARKFITAQLPEVTANAVSADMSLRRFKEKHKITNLDTTKGGIATNIERIQSQIDSVEAQLADLESRTTVLQSKLGMSSQQAIAVSSLSQSPIVMGLLEEFQEVEGKLADARSLYQEGDPHIHRIKDKQAQIKTLLKNQIAQVMQGQKVGPNGELQVGQIQQALVADLIKSEVTRLGLAKQAVTLTKQKAFYLKQAAILPGLEQQQRELERRRLVAESTYEALLKSLQQVRIQENQTVGNVRIIEPARVPLKPIASTKKSAIAVGSLGGILLAGAVLYLLEVTNKKIRTVQEARDLFEYTLLGTIPIFSKTTRTVDSDTQTSAHRGVQLPVIEKPRSPISESYRMLQANLKSLNSDNALKIIVVTSSILKEGKSTICANLAASMAQLGYRVLIVDADMHHPLQHQFWNISNVKGLSNIIAEQANFGKNVFHRVMENLDVITSGDLPANPLGLVASRRMATFLEECSNKYDYVLIDTPALAFAADATTLGRMADGVVIVTRPGVADSTTSRFAKEYLEQSRQNILGIVVNGVLPENDPHSSLLQYYAQEQNSDSSSRRSASSKERNWLDNFKFIKRS